MMKKEEEAEKFLPLLVTQLLRTEKWRQNCYKSFSPEVPLILKSTKEKLHLLKKRTGETYISKVGIEAFAKNQYLELSNDEITLKVSRQILLVRTWILIRSNLNDKKFSQVIIQLCYIMKS